MSSSKLYSTHRRTLCFNGAFGVVFQLKWLEESKLQGKTDANNNLVN